MLETAWRTVVNSPAIRPIVNPGLDMNTATALTLNALYNAPFMAPVRLANGFLQSQGIYPSVGIGLNPAGVQVGVTTYAPASTYQPPQAYKSGVQAPRPQIEPEIP